MSETTSQTARSGLLESSGTLTESADVMVNGPDVATHSSPDSDSWCTPSSLAHELGCWDLDPCSNASSHIQATRRIQLPEDGLADDWTGSVWCNPPYSAPLPWCRKLAAHSGPWAALLKADSTTKWFDALVRSGASWALFRARLRFERPDKAPMVANFASVLFWRVWVPPDAVRQRLWIQECR